MPTPKLSILNIHCVFVCKRERERQRASGREILIQNNNSAKDIPPPKLSMKSIFTHFFFEETESIFFFLPPTYCQEQRHGVRTSSSLSSSTESTPQSRPTPAIILRGFIREKGRTGVSGISSFYLFLQERPVSIINFSAIIFNVHSFLPMRPP
jgi:hypothetical protein